MDTRESQQKKVIQLSLAFILVLGAIFVTDLHLSLGVAAAVPYSIAVFISAWLPNHKFLFVTAMIATFLTVVGFFLSSPAEELWKAIFNRGIALFVIWGTAILLYQRKRTEVELERIKHNLEHFAVDREARLTGVLHYVPEGVIIIDETGTIDSVNRGAERLFGYRSEELVGQNVSILMPEPERSRHDGYIAAYVKSGEGRIIDIGPREVVGMRSDDSTFPLELSIGRMDVGGRLMFIGVARDITDRKHTEWQLRHTQSLETLGQLTSGIAHDFNNHLTVILGNLAFIGEYIDVDASAREYLDGIVRAANRAAELTQHLLAYARKQVLEPELIDVNKLVLESTEFMHRTLGADIEIETVLASGLWQTVADRGQLVNALLNLSLNSRDAMPNGGKLTIETYNSRLSQEYAEAHVEVAPGQYVTIAITDTGVGIPQDIVDHIFDPFFTTKEMGQGSGLGLSSVHGFVKQSGGHIKVYTEMGEGTTIKIYLPRASDSGHITARDITTGYQPAGDESILVVEDNSDVRAFALNALEVLGYTVYGAADGAAALELMKSVEEIDLLITDVVLPGGMNGRDVANAVRSTWPDVVVLYMSGYTENAIVHRGMLNHNTELLKKPFTRETLSQWVRRVLNAQKR